MALKPMTDVTVIVITLDPFIVITLNPVIVLIITAGIPGGFPVTGHGQ